MPQEIALSPEQKAQYDSQPAAPSGQPVELSPDQQAAYNQPTALDPLKDFSSDQLYELAKQDPEFRVLEQFSGRPELQKDPAMVSKIAQTLYRQKLDPWYTGVSVKGMAKGVGGFAKGAYGQVSNVAQNAADSISLGIGHLLGADEGTLDQLGRDIQKRVAESTSATEAATTGLVGQAVRLAKKVGGKSLDQYTEQDKVQDLMDALADLQQQQTIASGHGRILNAVGSDVVQNLEQHGQAVNPERVATLAQADPFAFEAMGKGLAPAGKVAGALVPEGVSVAAQRAAQATLGRGVQAVGTLVKPIATAVKTVAPTISKVAGGAAGGVAAGELNPAAIPIGVMEGVEKGGKLGAGIASKAGKVAETFDQLSDVGRQIAGAAPLKSALAVAGRQAAEAAPRVAGAAASGAAFDIGLQAATAQTPEERESFTPFGTIFGLAHGVKYAGSHVVSGMISAPREWGTNIRTPNTKNFPALNTVHDAGYDSAQPGVKNRVNALRQLVDGTGAELFYAPRPEEGQPDTLFDTLQGMGMSADRAQTFADKAAFATDINGKKVVVVRDVEAGPHDALHAIDDAVGATQVRELNDAVKGQYTPEVWDQMKARYASFLGEGDPNSTILEQTGWGDAEAKEKIIRGVHDLFQLNNETPTPEAFKQAAGEEIQRQQSDAKAAGKSLWETVLTPEEQNGVVDQYMGSEVRAENFDSAYKGIGDGKTLPDKLTHAIAGTMASLGFNPVAGRYSDLGFPLDYGTMKQGMKQAARNKPLVEPAKLPKVTAAVGTPQAQQQQQDRNAEIVKTAPDVKLPGAAKTAREMMGILNEAVISGSPVDIQYGHAGGSAPAAGADEPPAGALGSVSREDRRAVIEAWRQLPIATRSFMSTLFSPERFDVTKQGKYQVYGGSHAVLAANLQKLANFSLAHPEFRLPDGWTVDETTKSFTPTAWDLILDQVQKYSKNQLSGRAGSGAELVVPKMKGYFAPPVKGEAAPIPQDAADAINAVYGQKTPETARISKKDVVPLNVAGQRISEATIPGRVEAPTAESPEFTGDVAKGLGIEGQHVLEPNPFLTELNKYTDAPSFIEARRRLNLDHMADVNHAPAGSPTIRGNTLTMAAGFRPRVEEAQFRPEDNRPDPENLTRGRPGPGGYLSGYWLSPDGKFYDASPDHYRSAEHYITGPTKEDPRELAYKKGWVRTNVDRTEGGNQILIEGAKPNSAQRAALEDAAFHYELPVMDDSGQIAIDSTKDFYNPDKTQFKPRKRKEDWKLRDAPGQLFSKAWILPDGKPVQLGGQWHHEWVNENPDIAKRYGLKPTTSGEENRSEALQKGFARINYERNTGTMKVEARAQDWQKLAPSVKEMVQNNLGKIDNMDVHLLDSKAVKIVDQDGVALHTYDPDEKMDHLPLISEPTSTTTMSAQAPAESAQFNPAERRARDWERTRAAYEATPWWKKPPVGETETGRHSSFAGDAEQGVILHSAKQRSTQFIGKGAPAERFLKAWDQAKTESARDALVESYWGSPMEPTAQYKPSDKPGAVKTAALRDEDTGKIYEGPMHAMAKLEYLKEKYASRLDEDGRLPAWLELQAWNSDPNLTEGFTTTTPGEFLNREEAHKRAIEMKQYVAPPTDEGSLESQAFTRQQELKKQGFDLNKVAAQFHPKPSDETKKALAEAADVTKDERGLPKVFYHGTKQTEALHKSGKFDISKARPDAMYGPGFYFTEDPEVAGGTGDPNKSFGYAVTTEQGDSPGVVPAFLDVRHPFDIDKNYTPAEIRALFRKFGNQVKGPNLKTRPSIDYQLAKEIDKAIADSRSHSRRDMDLITDNTSEVNDAADKAGWNPDTQGRVSDFAKDYLDWKHENEHHRLNMLAAGLKEMEDGAKGSEIYDALTEFANDVHVAGIDANKTRVNALLKGAGFDGITHIGGNIVGDRPHRVVIAFSPEQVHGAFGGTARKIAGDKTQFRPTSAKPEDFKSEETLPTALQSPNWAILTATKEAVGPGTHPDNVAANEQLRKELVENGYSPLDVSGSYKGVDQGKNFLVPDMAPEEASRWGNKYGQESVLTPQGLLYGDGTVNPVKPDETVVGKKAEEQDFHSRVEGGPAFSMGIDFGKREPAQFKPNTKAEPEFKLEEGNAPAKALSKQDIAAMSNEDLAAHYPEAVIPKRTRNKKGELVDPTIDSDIVGSPLSKENGGPESPKAVAAFADKLVAMAKEWRNNPNYKAGTKWYSDFVPKLKKEFGKDAQLFAELLAATSPNNTPDVNFGFAYDAYRQFKAGKFDGQIKKFNEGIERLNDEESWQNWMKYNHPNEKLTPASFMVNWIETYGLTPVQSNGKRFGMHSVPVLKVLARKWLGQTSGPKTQNFIQNLVGSGHEATIDVWADRTMRRLGYEGFQDRWRILPKNATAVSDADFAFSQKAFREAADRLGIEPDALQGGLWFAEKQLWADKGWSLPGAFKLGDYRTEMEKLPTLKARFNNRVAQQELNLVAPRP